MDRVIVMVRYTNATTFYSPSEIAEIAAASTLQQLA